jgi:hypothetical protein
MTLCCVFPSRTPAIGLRRYSISTVRRASLTMQPRCPLCSLALALAAPSLALAANLGRRGGVAHGDTSLNP